MEAESRKDADAMLIAFNQKIGYKISGEDLIDFKIETLVVGESSKIKNKKKHIWVGQEHSKDGWMEQEEYLKIVHKNKKQQKNG